MMTETYQAPSIVKIDDLEGMMVPSKKSFICDKDVCTN